MAQQKIVSNGAQVELVKGIDASVFGQSTLSVLYSETKIRRQTQEMGFAIQFGESPGFVIAVSNHGYTLANAHLMRQKRIGSTEGTGGIVGGKCDYVFRDMMNPRKETVPADAAEKSERLLLLEKLSQTVKALSDMYVEDLQSANDCYLPQLKSAVTLLSKIGYAAHLAEEAVKKESEFLNRMERKE
jgi:hypothetical protein